MTTLHEPDVEGQAQSREHLMQLLKTAGGAGTPAFEQGKAVELVMDEESSV